MLQDPNHHPGFLHYSEYKKKLIVVHRGFITQCRRIVKKEYLVIIMGQFSLFLHIILILHFHAFRTYYRCFITNPS